jgi:catechol 2,3-dioxygenase-like lactoylglutathione lyase family enzyme
MPFKFSRCFLLQTPEPEKALAFYHDIMGLEPAPPKPGEIELRAGQFRFFLDKGEPMGPVMEYVVPHLDAAKAKLLAAGCKVVRWDGIGKPCYMRDPFGMIFNVFQETEDFKG